MTKKHHETSTRYRTPASIRDQTFRRRMRGLDADEVYEYIDLLSSGSDRMARIWQGGIAWLDATCRKRFNAAFLDATPAQRTELLDLIAYRRNDSPELGPGIEFFEWARRMVVDAYFTSPAGVKALGFQGNTGMQTFQVPAEALTYALKRSPFGA